MTNGSRRWPTQYWVFAPGNNIFFGFFLRHSRAHNVLEALIQNGATGCNFNDAPAPRWAASVHKLRKRGQRGDCIVRSAHVAGKFGSGGRK